MIVNVIERDPLNPTQIANVELALDPIPHTAEELIAQLVEYEIAQNKKLQQFEVKDDNHLRNLVKLGKVGAVIDPRQYQQANLKVEIEKAVIAFKHQDYYMFIDETEINDLNEKIEIKAGSLIVIIANIRFR